MHNSSNWLEFALKAGRFNIAKLVYQKGLGLSKHTQSLGYINAAFPEKINQFIEVNVSHMIFTEPIK